MRLVAIFALLLAIGSVAASMAVRAYLEGPLPIDADVIFEIPPGRGLNGVSADLAGIGVLARPHWFTLYGRLSGNASRLRAGEYRLEPGLTPRGLMSLLVSGNVVLHSLTVVEGRTFADLMETIAAHPALRHELDGQSAEEIAVLLELPVESPEGWFLPETYLFPRGTSDLTLLQHGRDALRAALDEAWAMRRPDLVLETPYEALILASIIEKETALDAERRRIAGVMTRRLERGMRLQADPTVIYGLGAAFDGDLRRRDLTRDTPYNTYTRSGLPPTPIALPGRASLLAAVDPSEDDALYYVATGAGDGSHSFSATLEEHNRAVARYLETLAHRRRGQTN
jgi:UPF0755 protein